MAKKKFNWLSSTLIVLLVVFAFSLLWGLWLYDWRTIIDRTWSYIVGATFTAIIIIVVTMFVRKKGKVKLW